MQLSRNPLRSLRITIREHTELLLGLLECMAWSRQGLITFAV
jgi:hypothetical protein